MSRSKEMGKPVAELTAGELRRERHRCQTMAKVLGNKIAAKGLRKRLYEIDKRLAAEEREKSIQE